MIGGLSRLDDSLARALCWGAAWDMTRDAELSATDFVKLVLGEHRGRDRRVRLLPDSRRTPPRPSTTSPPRPTGPSCKQTWEQGLRRLLEEAEPGSDHQLTYARAFAAAAHSGRGARRPRGAARRLARARRAHRRHRHALGAAHRPGPRRPRRRRAHRRASCAGTTRSPVRSAPLPRGPLAPRPRRRPRPGRSPSSATTCRTRRSAAWCSPSCSRDRRRSSGPTWRSTSRSPRRCGRRRAPSARRRRWSSCSRARWPRRSCWSG